MSRKAWPRLPCMGPTNPNTYAKWTDAAFQPAMARVVAKETTPNGVRHTSWRSKLMLLASGVRLKDAPAFPRLARREVLVQNMRHGAVSTA
jgi:hypothetical protein